MLYKCNFLCQKSICLDTGCISQRQWRSLWSRVCINLNLSFVAGILFCQRNCQQGSNLWRLCRLVSLPFLLKICHTLSYPMAVENSSENSRLVLRVRDHSSMQESQLSILTTLLMNDFWIWICRVLSVSSRLESQIALTGKSRFWKESIKVCLLEKW